MKMKKHILILLLSLTLINANDPELPLCPSDISYLPQDLPMHCRMRRNADPPPFPVPPGFPSPIFPPGPPGPPPMPPPQPGMPGAVPIQMMPVPAPGPAHKLPVIVMPFYSPDPAFKRDNKKRSKHVDHKRRRPRRRPRPRDTDSSDTDTDTDTDTSDSSDASEDSGGWWKGTRSSRRSGRRADRQQSRQKRKKHNKKKDLLTPIIQYVTKDGYVIFEKEISKTEAKDWLGVKNNEEKKQAQVTFKEIEDMNETEDANRDVEEVTTAKEEEEVEVKTQKVPVKRHRSKAQKNKSHTTKVP